MHLCSTQNTDHEHNQHSRFYPKKKMCFNLYLVRKSNHHRQVTKKSSLSIFVSGLDVVGNQKFVDVLAKIHHANIRIHPPPMPT